MYKEEGLSIEIKILYMYIYIYIYILYIYMSKVTFTWNTPIDENNVLAKFRQDENYIVGNNIVFVPYNQTKVGVFNTSNKTYNTLDINTENVTQSSAFFSEAVVVGNTIYFAPYNANYILYITFESATNGTLNIIDISSITNGASKFNNVRRVNNKLYFIPSDAPFVGVLDISVTPTPTFSIIRNNINAISTRSSNSQTIITLPKAPSEYLIGVNTTVSISNTDGDNWGNLNTTHTVVAVDNSLNEITLNVNSLAYGIMSTQPTVEVTNDSYTINNVSSNGQYTNIILNETLSSSTSPFQIGSNVYFSGGTNWGELNGVHTIVNVNYNFDIITINTSLSNFGSTSNFPTIYTNNTFNKFLKFDNSIVADGKIYMTPNSFPYTCVLDTSDESITFINHELTSTENNVVNKYADVALVDNKIVYTPRALSKIGIINTDNDTFSNITLTTVDPDNTIKYSSSVIYNNKVIFVPTASGYVTIFDPSTNAQQHISTGGLLFSPFHQKITPVNNKLVFTPSFKTVGVFHLATNMFTSMSNDDINIGNYFSFSRQSNVGDTVVFTPFDSNVIGVYDTYISTFETIDTGLTGDQKFITSTAHNSTVALVPYNANKVGFLTYSIICFLKDTLIETDQGIVRIDKLEPSEHTIRGMKIHKITKQVVNKSDTELVCIEKDAIDENVPDRLTIMTKHHRIKYKNYLIKAEMLVNRNKKIYKRKYEGESLYNILLDEYQLVRANNLECETLHPLNDIARLYNPEGAEKFVNFMKNRK